ncbi:MAG: amidohydrolase family protein [Pseudomonadota bacterium]|nr:amidohydrolase family protein [Pseudomonadota bacterium]
MNDLQAARAEFLNSGQDADLPIVDAHHHFWDCTHNPHPWLQQRPRVAFRYGDYEAICRDYLPADHARAAGAHRLLRSVLMEGEWDSRDPTGEARWVQALARRTGTPHAMAAQIWLDRDDLGDVLAAYRAMPWVRSVRHKPRCATQAEHHARWTAPGSMRCERWRAGYARLQGAGLTFELQAPWWHVDDAVALARDFPATALIVNHALLPAQRDAQSLATWAAAVRKLADCPNVWMKISGLGVLGQPWTVALQRPVVETLLASFGTRRCLFASNHPVDGLVASLETIFQGFKALTRHLPPAERLALFCDNAAALYRLD